MNSRAGGRTYRGVFGSRTPQRPEPGPPFAVSPHSPKFQRSNAQILGPGSYDPLPASAWQDFSSERPLSSFASTRAQRGSSNIGSSTKGIDLAHSSNLERSGSTHMNRSMYSTAPGSSGQRWTTSLRKAPYFHTPVRYDATLSPLPHPSRHSSAMLADVVAFACLQRAVAPVLVWHRRESRPRRRSGPLL